MKPEDLVISLYMTPRGFSTSGRGVSIKHKPTGIWASCDTERSEHANKAIAWEELEKKLKENTKVVAGIPLAVFKNLVRLHISETEIRKAFLSRLPSSISFAVTQNEYVDSLDSTLTSTLKLLLKEELVKELEWFSYDWRAGFEIWNVAGTKYEINNLEDYFKYLEAEFIWK